MEGKLYADLHNHTTFSDGDFSPHDLVFAAKKAGVSALGVTDHDTIDGIDEALWAGERHGIKIIPGVEVSVRFKRSFFTGTLHLLCYFSMELFKDLNFRRSIGEALARGRGTLLVAQRVKEINRFFGPLGITPMFEQELTCQEIVRLAKNASRRHFALALTENHGISSLEQVKAIIGNQSPAYVPSGIDLAEVTDLIEEWPMLGVLAHPAAGSFPGRGHYREVLPPMEIVERLFPEFLDAGLGGIEVEYPGHTMEHRAILRTWAEKHDLVITGGSDCHDGVERPLGVCGISREVFETFKGRIPTGRTPSRGTL
ncbi:MAG: PHP domain-containing protein [Desulfobacterium sp.]|jgi:predicted metal-dependent phosphoesterase TrpH|nr:PHP domain-containing protein [Desulfobacterium sp.]